MGKIFCLMGKSASGKDTLYRRILAEMPELHTYVMYSTRPRRAGETDGVSYHFVTEEELLLKERAGKLIEKRTYHTVKGLWTYATVDDGQIDLGNGDYLVPATLESYRKLKEYFGAESLVPLYIELDDGERLLRAVRREMQEKDPNYREVCRRFLSDMEDFSEEELEKAGIHKRYQNRDLERCVKELIADIRA